MSATGDCEEKSDPAIGRNYRSKLQPIQVSEAYTKALAWSQGWQRWAFTSHCPPYAPGSETGTAQAVRWQLLIRNPVDAVDPPKVERHRMTTYDMTQTAELSTPSGEPDCSSQRCLPYCAAFGAARLPPCAGAASILHRPACRRRERGTDEWQRPAEGNQVRQGAHGRISATVVEELKAHRLQQAQDMLKLGVRLTDEVSWPRLEDGSPMQPTFITHEWVRIISGTALPRVRFHDLRHAHATHMLSSGVHPKVASERLGHSKVGHHPGPVFACHAGNAGGRRRQDGCCPQSGPAAALGRPRMIGAIWCCV